MAPTVQVYRELHLIRIQVIEFGSAYMLQFPIALMEQSLRSIGKKFAKAERK